MLGDVEEKKLSEANSESSMKMCVQLMRTGVTPFNPSNHEPTVGEKNKDFDEPLHKQNAKKKMN